MSDIQFIESPNQSFRKRVNIDMIVIHATAGESFEGAVKWLTNPKSGVSAHYCIDKDGKIVQLVKEAKKSWHAGKSVWGEEDNLNENSIGIELVNKNDDKDPYPILQIDSLAKLIVDIQAYYNLISDDRIVGHDQISPGRKTDPGLNFPWVYLGVLIEKYRSALNGK